MIVLQIDGDRIGAIPSEGYPPVPGDPDRPALDALQRLPVWKPGRFNCSGRVAASSARSMRPTLATFGTLNPFGSPASKYYLSARLRQLRITGGNVMLQPANVKCRFTAPLVQRLPSLGEGDYFGRIIRAGAESCRNAV